MKKVKFVLHSCLLLFRLVAIKGLMEEGVETTV